MGGVQLPVSNVAALSLWVVTEKCRDSRLCRGEWDPPTLCLPHCGYKEQNVSARLPQRLSCGRSAWVPYVFCSFVGMSDCGELVHSHLECRFVVWLLLREYSPLLSKIPSFWCQVAWETYSAGCVLRTRAEPRGSGTLLRYFFQAVTEAEESRLWAVRSLFWQVVSPRSWATLPGDSAGAE